MVKHTTKHPISSTTILISDSPPLHLQKAPSQTLRLTGRHLPNPLRHFNHLALSKENPFVQIRNEAIEICWKCLHPPFNINRLWVLAQLLRSCRQSNKSSRKEDGYGHSRERKAQRTATVILGNGRQGQSHYPQGRRTVTVIPGNGKTHTQEREQGTKGGGHPRERKDTYPRHRQDWKSGVGLKAPRLTCPRKTVDQEESNA